MELASVANARIGSIGSKDAMIIALVVLVQCIFFFSLFFFFFCRRILPVTSGASLGHLV